MAPPVWYPISRHHVLNSACIKDNVNSPIVGQIRDSTMLLDMLFDDEDDENSTFRRRKNTGATNNQTKERFCLVQ